MSTSSNGPVAEAPALDPYPYARFEQVRAHRLRRHLVDEDVYPPAPVFPALAESLVEARAELHLVLDRMTDEDVWAIHGLAFLLYHVPRDSLLFQYVDLVG